MSAVSTGKFRIVRFGMALLGLLFVSQMVGLPALGAPLPARVPAGAASLFRVDVASAYWIADGAAAVVHGTLSCGSETEQQPTLRISQAHGSGQAISASAGVPSVTCDGAAHPWQTEVLAPDGSTIPWRSAPVAITIAVPTNLQVLKKYQTVVLNMTPGRPSKNAAIVRVDRQVDGLSLTVHFKFSCRLGEEINQLGTRIAQRVRAGRVLVDSATQNHLPCTGGLHTYSVVLAAPGPTWSAHRPLAVDIVAVTCSDSSGCSDRRYVTVIRSSSPAPAHELVIERESHIAAGGAATLVHVRIRCVASEVVTVTVSVSQRLPAGRVHSSIRFTNNVPCGPTLRRHTIPIPATPDHTGGPSRTLDRPEPLWNRGSALARLSVGDESTAGQQVTAEGRIRLRDGSAIAKASTPKVGEPAIRIASSTTSTMLGTRLEVKVQLRCKLQQSLFLNGFATQASVNRLGQRDNGGDVVECGPRPSMHKIVMAGPKQGPAWKVGRRLFVAFSVQSDQGLTMAWRTTTLRRAPNPGRPPAPRLVSVDSVKVLAAGAGAIVSATITCPGPSQQIAPQVDVVQPRGQTETANFTAEYSTVECGSSPKSFEFHVFGTGEDDNPTNRSIPLSPGQHVVATVSFAGDGAAGSESRVLPLTAAQPSDELIVATGALHARGAALEFALELTCEEASVASPATFDVRQVAADGTLQTLRHEEKLACGLDGRLSPVVIAAPFEPWSEKPALVSFRPAQCEFGCQPHLAAVLVSKAQADPRPTGGGSVLSVRSVTRQAVGAGAAVTVGVRCATPLEFLLVQVEIHQALGSQILEGSGQIVVPCGRTTSDHALLISVGGRNGVGSTRGLPLELGTAFVSASTPFQDLVAVDHRTAFLTEGKRLHRSASDAALVGEPRIVAAGAALVVKMRLGACAPGHSLGIGTSLQQVGASGRIATGVSEGARFVCSGEPQTVDLYIHATNGQAWTEQLATFSGSGDLCDFDFTECLPADADFVEVVQPRTG